MKKKSTLIFLIAFFTFTSAHAQLLTTYNIDYSYVSLSTTSCNVFSSGISIGGYEHKTSFGTPTFSFPSGSSGRILLKSQRSSSSHYKATQYAIKFPFKKGRRYKIKLYGKSDLSPHSEYPIVGVSISNSNGGTNSVTTCPGGPQLKPNSTHWTYGKITFLNAFQWSPVLYEAVPSEDQQYLLILGVPPEISSPAYSDVFTSHIQTINITEEILAVSPPTSGFEAKFYKNAVNGKTYIGMKGKYRQFFGDVFTTCFNINNINFIDINSDPPANLVGDVLAYTQGWLYDGEVNDLSAFFIIDEWTNKKYFVEAKRTTYPLTTFNNIEFHCTDITDVNKFNLYKFEMGTQGIDVWNFNSGNGYKVLFDGVAHPLGGGATAYFVQAPNLP